MRQVNLLPEDFRIAEHKKSVRGSVIVTIIFSLLAVLSAHTVLKVWVRNLDEVASRLTVIPEDPKITELRRDVFKLDRERQSFIDENKPLIEMLTVNVPYTYILKTIGNATLNKIWLNKFYADSDKKTCQIEGISFNTQFVSEYMFELKKIPLFSNVELSSIEKTGTSDKKEIEFKFVCSIE